MREGGSRGKCKLRRESFRAHRVAWVESARVRVSARARSHRIKQQVAELCESSAAVIPLSPALLSALRSQVGRRPLYTSTLLHRRMTLTALLCLFYVTVLLWRLLFD